MQAVCDEKEEAMGKIKLELMQKQDQEGLFQGQLEGLREDFERAKAIGQTQIDSLLTQIRQKDQQLQVLAQTEIITHASLSKTEPGLTPTKESPSKGTPSKSFLSRFYNFSREIDRKI